MTQQTSISQFSYIRVIACFSIVILHTLFASNVYFADMMSDGDVLATKTLEHMLMWPVPCFLMVTGALLLNPDKQLTYGKILGKYLRRILVALVVFTLIFQVLDYMAGDQSNIIGGWLSNLVFQRSWAHMWYFYVLAVLYILLPIFRRIVRAATDFQLMMILAGALLIFSLLPMIRALGVEWAYFIPTQCIYAIYMFVGYLLFNKPQETYIGIGLVVIPSMLIVVLSYYQYAIGFGTDDTTLEALYDYASPLVVMQAAGIFALMNRIKAPAGKFLKSLDKCSFGIYLVHMIGVRAVMKWWGFNPYLAPFSFVFMVLVFFFGAYGIVWCYKKAILIKQKPIE